MSTYFPKGEVARKWFVVDADGQTLGRLASVERAEAALRLLGFEELRVRHHGDVARIEVPELDLDAVLAKREAVVAAVQAAGYRWATLDLAGLRSGGFNQLL